MAHRVIRILLASAFAVLLVGQAVPVLAQNGTMSGRVIDAERRTTDRHGQPLLGKPKDPTGASRDPADFLLGLPEARVTLTLTGESPRTFEALTDAYGEWYKSGLPPGTYDISVKREWRDPVQGRAMGLVVFTAEATGIVLQPGEKLRVPDMNGMTEEARAAGRRPPVASNLSNAEAEAANKRSAELEAMLKEATAAADAGKHEEAIAQFEAFAKKLEEEGNACAVCYEKIGDSQIKLNNIDKAEAAFLKAIEQDPDLAPPYSQLASIYNQQGKFDEAAEMSKKASELMSGSGDAAGGVAGGDPITVYNSGIINWNAGKYEEARAAFQKAVEMDPKMANAQYYLGMAIFNLANNGKANLTDAKGPFQEYLKLEPAGEFAEIAKAILDTIK